LELREESVRLEDEFSQKDSQLRRVRRDLQQREAEFREQVAQIREEQETSISHRLETLQNRYRELTESIGRAA